MLNIKANPSSLFVTAGAEGEEGGEEANQGDFNWHCKNGLAMNIQQVKEEFCKVRGLKPFKCFIIGKPCSGKSHFAAQLCKHYNVPHIHTEQVLQDVQNWNKEKELAFYANLAEKERLQKLHEEKKQAKKEAKEQALLEYEEAKRFRREKKKVEAMSEWDSEGYVDDTAPPKFSDDELEVEAEKPKAAEDGAEAEPAAAEEVDEFQKEFDRLTKQYELDKAEEPETFVALEIKAKINQFFKDKPDEKKIPEELLNEAFRWRLSQNDCQNRGYILDGYPYSSETASGVFYITPKAPEKKPPVFDEEGNEVKDPEEVEVDPEELAKQLAPKFQKHIYPDSVIYLRGDDNFLMDRAAKLEQKDHKWNREDLNRRLANFAANNDISLFEQANNREDLGHPKAKAAKYPVTRFFQEHKTEVFEMECSSNEFEMFEDMRVYIERNGRSYNYLPSVDKLNQEREEALLQEEMNRLSENEAKKTKTVNTEKDQREALEKLQQKRLAAIKTHMKDVDESKQFNMRQFLMKAIIPVLTEGMIDVYRVGPTDPVDYLADYIYKKSNEVHKK